MQGHLGTWSAVSSLNMTLAALLVDRGCINCHGGDYIVIGVMPDEEVALHVCTLMGCNESGV